MAEKIVIEQGEYADIIVDKNHLGNIVVSQEGNKYTDHLICQPTAIPHLCSALSRLAPTDEEQVKRELIDAVYPIANDLFKQRVMMECLKNFIVLRKPQ